MRAGARTVVALCAALAPTAAPARGIAIERLRITENGARSNQVSGDETIAACRRFRLTAAEVRGFFALARRVDDIAFHHDLSMSRCHAAGRLRLSDGRRGRWFVDLERRGSLRLANGQTLYFYCLACRSPCFDAVDDDDRVIAGDRPI